MVDWLSYSLTDFLPLSRETYQRLFVLYNARFSPAFAVGLVLGLASLGLLLRGTAWAARLVLAGLGIAWLWIAWAFHLQTLAPLVWAAGPVALLFALQGGLLLAASVLPFGLPGSMRPRGPSWVGYAMLAAAVCLYPFGGFAGGRSLPGLELFGTAPDPTAIATLALATLLPPRLTLVLMPLPLLWCLVSGAARYGLGAPLWWIPVAAATAAPALGWWRHHSGGSRRRAGSP